MIFDTHPCRRNCFDVFSVDKSETGISEINRKVREAEQALSFNEGKFTCRDGTEWRVDAALLNNLKTDLKTPLRRLQVEQFVHQAQSFAEDDETRLLLEELSAGRDQTEGLASLMQELHGTVMEKLGAFLPAFEVTAMPDDFVPPEGPGPFPLEPEALETVILRER
jgi:hypothetical protein